MSDEPKLKELPVRSNVSCCGPGLAPRLSDDEAQTHAALFKALADPARLQILDILSQHAGQVCVCDFEGLVGLPDPETGQRPKQPTISHHLKVLRDAGLVDSEKRGLWVYYFLRPERLEAVRRLLQLLSGGQVEGELRPVGALERRCC